jgi:hypothetical protein
MSIEWKARDDQNPPPVKERLLLIVGASGPNFDIKLAGKSEVLLGFWTGDSFRPMNRDGVHGTDLNPRYWATLDLPTEIDLQSLAIFRPDAKP